MNRNIFVNIFRNYLVSVHRFFYLYIKWEKDPSRQALVVFCITIFSLYGFIDSYLDSPFLTTKGHFFKFSILVFCITLPIYFWYLKYEPKESELKNGKDAWSGVILFFISLFLLAFCRKFYF